MTSQLSFEDLPSASLCASAVIPQADPAEIHQLTDLLAAAATWLTARQISEQLPWDDRKIRKLAADSRGLIISGNHGYKHTKHATPMNSANSMAAWSTRAAK